MPVGYIIFHAIGWVFAALVFVFNLWLFGGFGTEIGWPLVIPVIWLGVTLVIVWLTYRLGNKAIEKNGPSGGTSFLIAVSSWGCAGIQFALTPIFYIGAMAVMSLWGMVMQATGVY